MNLPSTITNNEIFEDLISQLSEAGFTDQSFNLQYVANVRANQICNRMYLADRGHGAFKAEYGGRAWA